MCATRGALRAERDRRRRPQAVRYSIAKPLLLRAIRQYAAARPNRSCGSLHARQAVPPPALGAVAGTPHNKSIQLPGGLMARFRTVLTVGGCVALRLALPLALGGCAELLVVGGLGAAAGGGYAAAQERGVTGTIDDLT